MSTKLSRKHREEDAWLVPNRFACPFCDADLDSPRSACSACFERDQEKQDPENRSDFVARCERYSPEQLCELYRAQAERVSGREVTCVHDRSWFYPGLLAISSRVPQEPVQRSGFVLGLFAIAVHPTYGHAV